MFHTWQCFCLLEGIQGKQCLTCVIPGSSTGCLSSNLDPALGTLSNPAHTPSPHTHVVTICGNEFKVKSRNHER